MRQLPLIEKHTTTCVSLVPIFRDLDAAAQATVASYARPVALGKDELLHSQGERLAEFFVVHKGQVKLVRSSPTGVERIVRVVGPGGFVGENAFLTGAPADYRVAALADTRLCVFRHQDLAGLMTEHPMIGLQLLRVISERLQEAERGLARTALSVPQRLSDFLLDQPATIAPGGWQVQWSMPKKDVASYLGTTPESISRALSALEKGGLISTTDGETMLVDVDGLEELASQ